jgi:hypothetical protein
MAQWQLTVTGNGIRKSSVEKLVRQMKKQLGKDTDFAIRDVTPPESRANRFAVALGLVGEAKSEIESLRDELQEWYDNLPENFQSGDKGSELEEAVSTLDEIINTLEEAEGRDGDVSFPAMY